MLIKTNNVILCGNPGVGKSTLCNLLLKEKTLDCSNNFIFESGIAISGLTQTFETYENITDTPGLLSDDEHEFRKNFEEIKKAMIHNQNFILTFVIKLTSGRIEHTDLFTVKTILYMLENIKDINYDVIINQVPQKTYNKICGNLESYKEIFNKEMPFKTNNFFF